jgi:hypothetical protein
MWEYLSSSNLLSERARKNFRNRVVPYAEGVVVQSSGKAMRPEILLTDKRGIRTSGFKLTVDERVDVAIDTRRIIEPDVSDPPPAPSFEFITNHELVRPAIATVPFTGNYRQTPVSLQPRLIVGGHADLHWSAVYPENQSPDRGDVGVRLPFRTQRSWPKSLISAAALLLLIGVGLVTAAIHETDFSDLARAAMQTVGIGCISAAVAAAVKALDDIQRQK